MAIAVHVMQTAGSRDRDRAAKGEPDMCSTSIVYEECSDVVNAKAAEERLVAAAIQGEAAALEILAVRYKRLVIAITGRMIGNFVEAEDLTQQALMKAFANLPRFAGRCSFSTWLISIAINEARMWLRKSRKSREVAMSDLCTGESLDVPPDFMDSRPGPEATYSQTERTRLLVSELARLKPGTRVALQLCDLEEQSSAEAAVALGITTTGVKSRRQRGRVILRDRLQASFTSAKPHRAGKVTRSRRSSDAGKSRAA